MEAPDPNLVAHINGLSHLEMAKLYRFSLPGSSLFDGTKPYFNIFMARFKEFGGMTPEISKHIGW